MSKRLKEITLDEAAARLGIDRATAYRWAKNGKLTITTQIPRNAPRILVDETSVSKLEKEAATA